MNSSSSLQTPDSGLQTRESIRAAAAAETDRIAAVRKACSGRHPQIEARAIRDGWNEQRTELEVLRADRPSAPAIHSRDTTVTALMLEAACMLTGKAPDVEKEYDEPVLDAADRRFKGGINFRNCCSKQPGPTGMTGGRSATIALLRFAFSQGVAAASSTIDIGASCRTWRTSSCWMGSSASNARGGTSVRSAA